MWLKLLLFALADVSVCVGLLPFLPIHSLEPLWVFAPALVWIGGSVVLLEAAKWIQTGFAGKLHEGG